MSKFAIGDIVEIIALRTDPTTLHVGDQCEIILVGPFRAGHIYQNGGYTQLDSDYRVRGRNGGYGSYMEWQLRKFPGNEDFIPPAVRAIFNPKKEIANA